MSNRVVTDSACLIGLERIGQIDLLPSVFSVVFAPPAVGAECGFTTAWLQITPVGNTALVAALQTQLEAGESETIALAMELDDVRVLLDDKKARRIAKQLGLKVIGTVGMLLRAKQVGVIDTVKPLLDALDAVDFRISAGLRQEAIRLAGEMETKNE